MNEIYRILEVIHIASLHGHEMSIQILAGKASGKTDALTQYREMYPNDIYMAHRSITPFVARQECIENKDKKLIFIDDMSEVRSDYLRDWDTILQHLADHKMEYATKFTPMEKHHIHATVVIAYNPKTRARISKEAETSASDDRYLTFAYQIKPDNTSYIMRTRAKAMLQRMRAKIEFKAVPTELKPLYQLSDDEYVKLIPDGAITRQNGQICLFYQICKTYGYDFDVLSKYIYSKDKEYENMVVEYNGLYSPKPEEEHAKKFNKKIEKSAVLNAIRGE